MCYFFLRLSCRFLKPAETIFFMPADVFFCSVSQFGNRRLVCEPALHFSFTRRRRYKPLASMRPLLQVDFKCVYVKTLYELHQTI